MSTTLSFTRRDFIKSSGYLVVGVAAIAGADPFTGLVEAQAAGCPVIAYKAGGALETVAAGTTGLFFEEQSVASLIDAIQRFNESAHCFRQSDLVDNARRFSKEHFTKSFQDFVG